MTLQLSDDAVEQQRSHTISSYVLVVDDDSSVRSFLTRCLEGCGYAVQLAGSAAEAIDMMVVKPASMVLCDIKMPGQDGVWLAERIRAHWPRTAIIMVTAIDDLETIRRLGALGVADYITKPVTPERLLDVVRRATAELTDEENGRSAESTSPSQDLQTPSANKIDAEYTLECPVRCPSCGERISNVKAVRLVRTQVNFTSTLPRRGRVIACPLCHAAIPGELSNF